MLQLASAGKRFGHKLLFENADWLITPDERTGLVGANGTGKSTLLKILAEMETLDYGDFNDNGPNTAASGGFTWTGFQNLGRSVDKAADSGCAPLATGWKPIT